MEPLNKIWQVEIDGKIEEADLETLKDWIESGKVSASSRVRRDSLRWIEISEVKILSQCFQPGAREPRREKTQHTKPHPTQPIPKKIPPPKPPPKPPFAARPSFQPPPEKKTSFKIHLLIMAVAASVMSAGYVFYVNSKEWQPNKYALSTSTKNSSLTMPEDYVEPSAIAKYKANEELLNSNSMILPRGKYLPPPCPMITKSMPDRYESPSNLGYTPPTSYLTADALCASDYDKEMAKLQQVSTDYRAELRVKKNDLERGIKIEAAKNFAKSFVLLFLVFLVLNFVGNTFATRRQYSGAHP